jgi:hypothetical protein
MEAVRATRPLVGKEKKIRIPRISFVLGKHG